MVKNFLFRLLIVALLPLSAYVLWQETVDSRQLDIVVNVDSGASYGTGFYINPQNILTNKHVVGDNPTVFVYDANDHKQLAKVIKQHPTLDLVVLEVPETNNTYSSLYCDMPAFGENVNAVGRREVVQFVNTPLVIGSNWFKFPYQQTEEVTQKIMGANRLVVTGNLNPGSSGSPLFVENTVSVVGMVSAVLLSTADDYTNIGVNLAISMKDVCPWLEQEKIDYSISVLFNKLYWLQKYGFNKVKFNG